MELTQEYLDKQLGKLATKDDLREQTEELKTFSKEQTEELARIIATTVAEPMERHFEDIKDLLQMKEKIEQHGLEIQRLKQQLNLT